MNKMRPSQLVLLALAVLLVAARAQADDLLPLPPDRPAQQQSTGPKEASVHTGPPRCLRWSDNCVSCARARIEDTPACSNIGPACQPGPIQCLQSVPADDDNKVSP
ncbi:putative protein OS=Afipia felis OX=1035 GN=NCTC12722_01153 PE=4 SV=1 [Afipia felis]